MKSLSNINVSIVLVFCCFRFSVRPYFEAVFKVAQQIWNLSFLKITKTSKQTKPS